MIERGSVAPSRWSAPLAVAVAVAVVLGLGLTSCASESARPAVAAPNTSVGTSDADGPSPAPAGDNNSSNRSDNSRGNNDSEHGGGDPPPTGVDRSGTVPTSGRDPSAGPDDADGEARDRDDDQDRDRDPGRRPVVCGADPDLLGFDPFYDQHCDAAGIPVLASSMVASEAVESTAELLVAMIGHRPDLIEVMVTSGLRVAVMARTEVISDLPEYRDIYELFPGTDWDTRTRGLGATTFIPLSSVAEENVLCLPGDVYRGESILVHEFAHTVHIMGLELVDPGFSTRLEQIYDRAMADGRWANTYAATDPAEYFAEAVQSWFDSNQIGPAGGDGVHNDVDTRVELAGYDPEIHRLIADVFTTEPLPLCRP